MSPSLTILTIIVIGGGIGGLSTAIFLAQDGHRVTVLERRAKSDEYRHTGGVALTNNSISLFQKRQVWDHIAATVDIGDTPLHTRYSTGEVIAQMKKPFSYALTHRADLLKALYELAVESGADVRFEIIISDVNDDEQQPSVRLADGTMLEADLLVGADGISSLVRRYLFPDCKPQLTHSVVMLLDIPKSVMQSSQRTMELWQDLPYRLYFGPGRSIVSWAVTKHDPPIYHLQMCDHQYEDGLAYSSDPDPPDGPFISTMTDTSGLCKRWSDFEPAIQLITNSTPSYTKWKIAELPPLEKYSSMSSRIVLLGDAAHAVPPFAGQGANMSIEDGECLASLLQCINSKSQIRDAVSIYDSLRTERLARLRQIIKINIQTFSLNDGDSQKDRDTRLANEKLRPESENGRKDWKVYGNAERLQYLEGYEIGTEARNAWATFEKLKE